MSVMEFVLFSATLRTLPASSVSNHFAIIQTKQHSMKPKIEKKIMALFIQFHYKREVYYERTVHSLL